jgi:exonuclease III
MRLISWNVSRAGPERIACQVAALAERGADIVALQEVRVNRVPDYRHALERAGFTHIADGFAGVDAAFAGRRAIGVLVASTLPMVPLPEIRAKMALPWPERLLSVLLDTPGGPVELHNVYVPIGYGGRGLDLRTPTLQGLYAGLARPSSRPRILCGDLNLPQHELPDGTIITFGQTRRKNGIFAITHAAMHASELKILRDLAAFDLCDVYRALHGYTPQEKSWFHPVSGNGFRLDHILASRALRPAECRYLDHFRAAPPGTWETFPFAQLSDHAAIEAAFALEEID